MVASPSTHNTTTIIDMKYCTSCNGNTTSNFLQNFQKNLGTKFLETNFYFPLIDDQSKMTDKLTPFTTSPAPEIPPTYARLALAPTFEASSDETQLTFIVSDGMTMPETHPRGLYRSSRANSPISDDDRKMPAAKSESPTRTPSPPPSTT